MTIRFRCFGVIVVCALVVVTGGYAYAQLQANLPAQNKAPDLFKTDPEGFTRAEMAQRVQVVAKIAQHKQPHKHVRLGRTAYLRVSQPRFVTSTVSPNCRPIRSSAVMTLG